MEERGETEQKVVVENMELHGIFDSHAHYFDRRFEQESEGGADAILNAVLGGTVGGIINVGTNPATSRAAIGQAKRYDGMYAAVGIHPEDGHFLCAEDALDDLRTLLGTTQTRARDKIVAIGEIGLDYHAEAFGEAPLDRRLEAFLFDEQLTLAGKEDLPVIIHDRDAHGDVFEAVLRHPDVRGVMHSFSGSPELAREYVRRGWYISFSGTLTFRNASRVREAALAVPHDRLLIETDCPYLAPHPFRGSLNHSGMLIHTVAALAELWGCDPQEAADRTAENAEKLFLP